MNEEIEEELCIEIELKKVHKLALFFIRGVFKTLHSLI